MGEESEKLTPKAGYDWVLTCYFKKPQSPHVPGEEKDGHSYPSISHLLQVAVSLGDPVPFRVRCWPLRDTLWVITIDIPGSCGAASPLCWSLEHHRTHCKTSDRGLGHSQGHSYHHLCNEEIGVERVRLGSEPQALLGDTQTLPHPQPSPMCHQAWFVKAKSYLLSKKRVRNDSPGTWGAPSLAIDLAFVQTFPDSLACQKSARESKTLVSHRVSFSDLYKGSRHSLDLLPELTWGLMRGLGEIWDTDLGWKPCAAPSNWTIFTCFQSIQWWAQSLTWRCWGREEGVTARGKFHFLLGTFKG